MKVLYAERAFLGDRSFERALLSKPQNLADIENSICLLIQLNNHIKLIQISMHAISLLNIKVDRSRSLSVIDVLLHPARRRFLESHTDIRFP